jgi:hypothetical protein
MARVRLGRWADGGDVGAFAQSKLVGMMEHLVSILWAVATAAAVIGSWATLVPLAAVAAVLAANRKWAAMAGPARA